MSDELKKPYNPSETEDKIYKLWEDSGFFNPDKLPGSHKDRFSMVLPPPNVTGTLHMGHAVMLAVEDIMARYKRMNGYKTLWIPGTDHAAIATQVKVEKILEKEGAKKNELGREKFLERVNQFAKESHDTIIHQVKKMGASLDWSREAFTLDKERELAVYTAFKKMYEDGLIYQGVRIINWDPKAQTTVSDDEVEHRPTKGKFYTFKYTKDFPIAISTTRPETKLGDTGVAVHPNDKRYKKYVGKTYEVNFAGSTLTIKIVADDAVDPEFGTGAVGITPAHSQTDYEIATRHGLPSIQVINEFGKITLPIEGLEGEKILSAREKIIDWLKENDLLEKEEEVEQNISISHRSGATIEPLPKKQWFIDVNKEFVLKNSKINGISPGSETNLKEIMKKSVSEGQIKIMPERFEKTYFHWIDNLRDWNISRQIWYGHRIPVWYKNNEIYVGVEAPNGNGWIQDEDTLDTWFSSGLWTFSTLGWPNETEDLKFYHPTDMLETGYDILFFWVARMILMSGYLLGDIPFKNIYLHGLIRDKDGKKMSKSIGNVIDPLTMIEKYGADAVRMSLIVGTGPGNDSRVAEEKIKAYKHFANKIWNATRFVTLNTKDFEDDSPALTPEDGKSLKEFAEFKKEITSDMEEYRFYLAGEKLYHYFWHTFADIIIEESKDKIFGDDEGRKKSAQKLLITILEESLVMLHPFMPFITEEIWTNTLGKKSLLMIENWPNF